MPKEGLVASGVRTMLPPAVVLIERGGVELRTAQGGFRYACGEEVPLTASMGAAPITGVARSRGVLCETIPS
jgi:hypothetical protein